MSDLFRVLNFILLLLLPSLRSEECLNVKKISNKYCSCTLGGSTLVCNNADLSYIQIKKDFKNVLRVIRLNGIIGLKKLDNTFLSALSSFPYLEELSISNCTSFLKVNGDFLWRFPLLKHLRITGSCLKAFVDITKPHDHLQSLILNDNQIDSLLSVTLHNLKHLQRLEINHNLLKEILPKWFPINSSLKYLSLENNMLHGLDPSLDRHLNQLETLLLANNLFSGTLRTAKSQRPDVPSNVGVPPLINNGKNILSSDNMNSYHRPVVKRVKRSLLNECPPENEFLPEKWGLIPVLPDLITLDLSNNCLNELQSVLLMHFTHLTHLLLPGNRLKSIGVGAFYIKPPNEVTRKRSRDYLDDGYNADVETTYGLQLLDLSNNNGLEQVINNWTFGLKHIEEIRLNDCSIKKIYKNAFQDLKKLRVLYLQRNNLSRLTNNSFKHLMSLEELRLDHNMIDSLHREIFRGLSNLKHVSLSGNRISSLSVDTPNIIPSAPGSRSKGNILNEINVIKNGGTHLSETQDLHDNNPPPSYRIGSHKSVFSDLNHLTSLDLSHNNISTLRPGDLQGLQSLVTLNLLSNPLKRLEQDVLCNLPRLQDVKIDSRQLVCDCHLYKTLDCILIKKLQIAGICSQPQHLRGRLLTSLQFSDLESGQECASPLLNVVLHTNAYAYNATPPPQLFERESSRFPLDLKWLRVNEQLTMDCDVIMSAANGFGQPLIKWERIIQNIPNQRFVEIVPGQRRAVLLYPPRRMPYSDSKPTFGNKNRKGPVRILWRSSLQIQSLSQDDAGTYRCSAKTSQGDGHSKLTEIGIFSKPKLVVTPDSNEISCLEGDTVGIVCKAEGYPQPDTALKIVSSKHFHAALSRRVLVSTKDEHYFFITNVQLEDAGKYMCHSVNIAGEDSFNFTVNVNSSPKFTETPSSRQRIFQNQDLVLHVNMTGHPSPTISWMKSGRLINTTTGSYNMMPGSVRLTEGNRKLTLFKMRPEDAAVYSIVLSNPLGSVVYNVTIDVVSDDYRVFTGSPLDVTHGNPEKDDAFFQWLSKHWVGVIVIAVVLCVVITSLLWVLALVCLGWKKHILPGGRHSSPTNGIVNGVSSNYRPVRQENTVDDVSVNDPSTKQSLPSLSALLSGHESAKILHPNLFSGNYPVATKPTPTLPKQPPPSGYSLGNSIDHLDSALSEWSDRSTFIPRSSSVANPEHGKNEVSFSHMMQLDSQPHAHKLTKSHNSLASCSSLVATGNTPMFRRNYHKANLYPGSSASSNPVSATSDYNTATSGGSCESGSSPIEDEALLSTDPPPVLPKRTNSVKQPNNYLRHFPPSNKKTNLLMTSSLHQGVPYDNSVNNSVINSRGLPPLHRSHSSFSNSNSSNNKKLKLYNPMPANGKPKFAHTPV